MLCTQLRRATTLACALVLIVAAAPAAALATTQSASSGAVSATFTFKAGPNTTFPTKTLTIARSGRVVYRKRVMSQLCGAGAQAQTFCGPAARGPGQSSVHVVGLEPGSEPNIVLDLYTGGAHCCSIEQVFSFDPGSGTYVMSEHNFRDPGDRIVDLGHNGRHEFLTADASFAYAFNSFAGSGLPIQILAFANGRFTNLTTTYPKLIAKDASVWLATFKHHYRDGNGLIAAWAADEDLLGHHAQVDSYLRAELKKGHLNGGAGNAQSGQKFITALHRFLRKHGYLH